MSIKAIVVDLDGTLTDANKLISTRGIDVLREIQDDGILVCLASGNVLPIAHGISTYLGFKGPTIAENGGIVCHGDNIYTLFTSEVPEKAFKFLKSKIHVEKLQNDQWRQTEVAIKNADNLQEIRKLLVNWDVEIEASGFAIHILDKGHEKMMGVKKVSKLLGILPEEFVAFGDSDNDVSMLRGCGLGIAVANASNAAKNAADYVSSKSYADGVIDGLQYLNLLGVSRD